jgi:plasmid stabilization system protein ParE
VAARVEWAPDAVDDLAEIEEYIARDNRASRVVPEVGDPDVREVFLRDYRIIFRVRADGIRVLRVVHGARRGVPRLE